VVDGNVARCLRCGRSWADSCHRTPASARDCLPRAVTGPAPKPRVTIQAGTFTSEPEARRLLEQVELDRLAPDARLNLVAVRRTLEDWMCGRLSHRRRLHNLTHLMHPGQNTLFVHSVKDDARAKSGSTP
jgi:hypothetical protein